MKIFAAGHSTFRLEMDGHVILTDPWFKTSGPLYNLLTRRIFPLALDPDSIKKCDLMLVSHNHIDHLSREALEVGRKLGAMVAGPPGVARRARRSGIFNCRSLRPGDCFEHDNIRITAVPAVHPLSKNPVGFLIEGCRSVYFSGDTRFDWEIVNALRGKQIDIAILQVSCSFYTLLNGSDGMDINYAAELAGALRPKCVIPMHFDCVGKYLDLTTGKKVSGYSLDVEDALNSFKRRLSARGIGCELLFAGGEMEI